jgi:hypothetical protein
LTICVIFDIALSDMKKIALFSLSILLLAPSAAFSSEAFERCLLLKTLIVQYSITPGLEKTSDEAVTRATGQYKQDQVKKRAAQAAYNESVCDKELSEVLGDVDLSTTLGLSK